MKNILGNTSLEVSRIGLGTVEIGLAYGLGNTGLPSEQDAISLLQRVVEMGVTYIDTARGYGLAEERIGKSEISKNEHIVIGTKCAQFLKTERDISNTDLEKRIREEIDMSRTFLRQESLQLVQIHNELEDYTNFAALIEIMEKLKEEQKIQHVGIAIRGEATALAALNTNFFETIQASYNIVDQRMTPRIFALAQEKHVGIINRSVLLKGALTNKRDKLPESLQQLKENADAAAKIAQSINMDLPTLALRFTLSNQAVSTSLIGTTQTKHIESALEIASQESLPQNILEQLHMLAIHDTNQIDPAKWPAI